MHIDKENRLILTALISQLALTKQVNIPKLNQQLDAFDQCIDGHEPALDGAKQVLAQIQRALIQVETHQVNNEA